MQQLIAASTSEVFAKARAEDAAAGDVLREALRSSAGKNQEFCIKNEDFCIKMRTFFYVQNDEFCRSAAGKHRRDRCLSPKELSTSTKEDRARHAPAPTGRRGDVEGHRAGGLKMMNFVLKTRNFVFKTRNCVSKTRDYKELQGITRNFVSKMMNFADCERASAEDAAELPRSWEALRADGRADCSEHGSNGSDFYIEIGEFCIFKLVMFVLKMMILNGNIKGDELASSE